MYHRIAIGSCLFVIACSNVQPSLPEVEPHYYFVEVARPTKPKLPELMVAKEETITPRILPRNMIEVEGNYCPVVEEKCLKRIDDLRCVEFTPSKCISKERKHLHFLIDKFEWPNEEGAFPESGLNWHDAKKRCESVGKRLCEEEEWNISCEGEGISPYPYGLKRDNTVCNIDKRWIDFRGCSKNELYQGVRSSSDSACRSPFGVIDMSGNVDEIINRPNGKAPYRNESTGGYWGPVRDRCRPKTRVHNEFEGIYQTGTRCCKDI